MKFLVKFAFYGVAYVAGTVSPAIGRKIKAFFAKEETAVGAHWKAAEAKFDAELKKL
jgi:3D (Asp-Asp-Asp) domain-containing protein